MMGSIYSKIVLQKFNYDCSIAAVATITSQSYYCVAKICDKCDDGLFPEEVNWLINHFGRWKLVYCKKSFTLLEWSKKRPFCLAIYPNHVVSIIDGEIYDPSGQSPKLDKIVCYLIVPWSYNDIR